MRVEVITQTMSNPVITNGGQTVVDAFMRIYGVDIKKAGCLNMVELRLVIALTVELISITRRKAIEIFLNTGKNLE